MLFKKLFSKSGASIASALREKADMPEGFYWAFLSCFKKAHRIQNEWLSTWSEVLGKPHTRVVAELVTAGLLKQADVKEKIGLRLGVQSLKQSLKQLGLKTSGKKDELLERYVAACPTEAELLASAERDVYVCTPEGKQKVDHYEAVISAKQQIAEEGVRSLMMEGAVERAARLIREFNKIFPAPLKRSEPCVEDAQLILRIKEVPGLTKDIVESERINAASAMLWNGAIACTSTFTKYAGIQVGKKRSVEALKEYAESGVVSRVRILDADDSCEQCKAAAKKTYLLSNAPILPIDECQGEMGCRCCYVAVFKD